MPQSDPRQGATFLPLYTETYQIPDTLAAMYNFLLDRVVEQFATTTARDAAIPSPTDQMVCATGTGTAVTVWIYAGGWKVLWQVGVWQAITNPGGFTYGTGADAPAAMLGADGQTVHLRGKLTRTAGAFPLAYTTVGTLPAGLAPAGEVRAALAPWPASTASAPLLRIAPASSTLTVSVSGTASAAADVYLRGISYRRD